MLSNPATLDLVTTFPHRVSEAMSMTEFPPEILAIEEDRTGDLLAVRLATALLGMLDERQLAAWHTLDTSTTDPTASLTWLLQTVDDADMIVAEETELLFNELTAIYA